MSRVRKYTDKVIKRLNLKGAEKAAFLATAHIESGNFSTFEENLNYRASTLKEKRNSGEFSALRDYTDEQINELVRKGKRAIANVIYGNNRRNSIGNTQEGDGWKFRGRGIFQFTGRSMYTDLARHLKKEGKIKHVNDILNNPDILIRNPSIREVADEWYWTKKIQPKLGSRTDTMGNVTNVINRYTRSRGERQTLFEKYFKDIQIEEEAEKRSAIDLQDPSKTQYKPENRIDNKYNDIVSNLSPEDHQRFGRQPGRLYAEVQERDDKKIVGEKVEGEQETEGNQQTTQRIS